MPKRFSRAGGGRWPMFGSRFRPGLAESDGFHVPEQIPRAGGGPGVNPARASGPGSRDRTVPTCRSCSRVPEAAGRIFGSRFRPGLARSHGFDVPERFSRAGGGRGGSSARDSGAGSRSLPRLAESGDSGVRGRFSRAEDGRTAQDRRFGSQSRPRLAELNGFDVPDGFLRAGGSRAESSARGFGLGSRNRTVSACRTVFHVPEVPGADARLAVSAQARGIGRFRRAQTIRACRR